MSDPIAQAAQQIQHEDKPQGIAAELVNEFHKLEEKVEHFLHPDAPAVAQPGEPQPSTQISQEQSATQSSTGQASTESTQPTSQPGADTTAKSSEQEGTGEGEQGNASAALAAAALINPNATGSQDVSPIPTSGGPVPGGDSPNAAPAADAQPATQPSVQAVSTPAGMPTTGVSLPANGIRASLQAIRNHLRIRGFEQSAVADIHKELEAIERWL
jgi:hypothetical protein